MKTVYHFVSDPGHGWLKVDVSEIDRLGIRDDISLFSYERNGVAYLEEDSDLRVFLDAKKARGEEVKFKMFRRNRQSRIRSYAIFGGYRMVTRTNIMTGKQFQERADRPFSCSPRSETYWCS